MLHTTQRQGLSQGGIEVVRIVEVTPPRSTPDQEVRAEGYRELQQIFFDEAIQCQQFWVQQAHVLSPELRGVETTSRGALLYPHLWHFE